jgi:hypothetical protein
MDPDLESDQGSYFRITDPFHIHALQRKNHLCIPFLGIAQPQSQFPHSCVCELFIYSQDRPTFCLAEE